MATKKSLLRQLTGKELRELCKLHKIKGFSGLKQTELVEHIAQNLDIDVGQLEALVGQFKEDRLLGKIADCRDYFATGNVILDHVGESVVKARVGGYSVTIRNLGSDGFSYDCDERCHDWLYQVQKGRYPFCKHYAAVVAELIYQGKLTPGEPIDLLTENCMERIEKLVAARKADEGLVQPAGRNLEERLANLREDLMRISQQDQKLARDKYHGESRDITPILGVDTRGLEPNWPPIGGGARDQECVGGNRGRNRIQNRELH